MWEPDDAPGSCRSLWPRQRKSIPSPTHIPFPGCPSVSQVTGDWGRCGGFNPNRASLDPSDSKGREINVILGVLGRSHLPGGSSRAGKHRSQREIGSYPPDCLSKWDTVYILFTFLQGRCSERVINHLCSCWATSCCRPSKIHTTKPALITAPSALHSSQLLMHSHLFSLSVSLLLSSICCFLPFAISRGTLVSTSAAPALSCSLDSPRQDVVIASHRGTPPQPLWRPQSS